MGRLPSGNRKYNIQRVQHNHREIMRLSLQGLKPVDIATHLGLSSATIHYTLNSPLVRRRMEELQAVRDVNAIDVSKRIREIAEDAVEVLGDIVADKTESPALRARTSIDILDRAGFGAVKKIATGQLDSYLSKDDIEDIKRAANEPKQITDQSEVVDTEVTDAVDAL